MSGIDTMRDAAAKLRTLAEAASPGEWGTQPGAKGWTDLRTIWIDPDDPTFGGNTFLCQIPRAGDAEYIAAMHPTVGLAVAAVLEDTAEYMQVVEMSAADAEKIYGEHMDLARAILGGAS